MVLSSKKAFDLNPETLKKAGLYKLIEELVLSEHERTQRSDKLLSRSNECHVIEQPSGQRSASH